MYIFLNLIIMLYIDMLSIILHATYIHHSNVGDIDRNSCTLLFNLYIQCHCIAIAIITTIAIILILIARTNMRTLSIIMCLEN